MRKCCKAARKQRLDYLNTMIRFEEISIYEHMCIGFFYRKVITSGKNQALIGQNTSSPHGCCSMADYPIPSKSACNSTIQLSRKHRRSVSAQQITVCKLMNFGLCPFARSIIFRFFTGWRTSRYVDRHVIRFCPISKQENWTLTPIKELFSEQTEKQVSTWRHHSVVPEQAQFKRGLKAEAGTSYLNRRQWRN